MLFTRSDREMADSPASAVLPARLCNPCVKTGYKASAPVVKRRPAHFPQQLTGLQSDAYVLLACSKQRFEKCVRCDGGCRRRRETRPTVRKIGLSARRTK